MWIISLVQETRTTAGTQEEKAETDKDLETA